MGTAEGFAELSKVASDYINNGMGKQGTYVAVREARTRAANREKDAARQPDTKHVAPAAPAREDVPRAIDNPDMNLGDNTLPQSGAQNA